MLVENRLTTPLRPAKLESPARPLDAETPPDVDFATLDSPQKVALLPALNPINFLRLVETAAQARPAGYQLDSSVNGTYGKNTSVQAVDELHDLSKREIDGQGSLGGVGFKEVYHFEPGQGLLIDGNIGSASEHLVYAQGSDGVVRLDGKIGAYEVHETFLQTETDDGPTLRVKGSVGDQALEFSVTTRASGDPKVQATQHLQGTLGSSLLTYDEVVTSTDPNNLLGSGQGNFAGTPVTLQQSLVLTKQPGT